MQLVTFFVGPHPLGLDVLRVQEVLRSQPVTHVPVARETIAGLLNLRGQILTALDLRAYFGFGQTEDPGACMNVIVPHGESIVSLVADRVGDVLQVEDGCVEPLPPNTPGELRPLLRGVVAHEGRLLFILDADKALARFLDQAEAA